MEELKEIITCALDQKGVLARLKAELRANVFLAVDEQDRRQGAGGIASRGDISRRGALCASQDGALLLDLVHEFLVWADLRFTAKVFEAETLCEGVQLQRRRLAAGLGLAGADGLDQPLLMALLTAAVGSCGHQAAQPQPPHAGPGPEGPAAHQQRQWGAAVPKLPLAGLAAGPHARQGGGFSGHALAQSGLQAPDGAGTGSGLIPAGRHHAEGGDSGSGSSEDGGYSASEEGMGGEQGDGEQHNHADPERGQRRLRGESASASAPHSEPASGGGGSETEELEGGSSADTLGLPGLGAGAAPPVMHPRSSRESAGGAGAGAGAGLGMVPPVSPPGSQGAVGSSGDAGSHSPGARSGGSWGETEATSPGQGHLPLHLVPLQPARKLAPLPAAAPKGAAAAFDGTMGMARPTAGSPQQQVVTHTDAAAWTSAAGGAASAQQREQQQQQQQQQQHGAGVAYMAERVIHVEGSTDSCDGEELPEELPSEVQDEASSQLFTVLRPAPEAAADEGPERAAGAAATAARGSGGPGARHALLSGLSASDGDDGGEKEEEDGSEYLAEALRLGGGVGPALAGPGAGGMAGLEAEDGSEDEF